eukprot:6149348-Amphidinium_carterae.1
MQTDPEHHQLSPGGFVNCPRWLVRSLLPSARSLSFLLSSAIGKTFAMPRCVHRLLMWVAALQQRTRSRIQTYCPPWLFLTALPTAYSMLKQTI